MPNFVKNKIIVGRSEFGKRLIEKYCVYKEEREELEFDFNKVIKMPDELRIEFSSKSDHALCLYLTKVNPLVNYYGTNEEKMDKILYDNIIKELSDKTLMKYDFTLSENDIYKVLDKYKEENELLELGERQINNLKNYGSINWYEWSIRNWGTKWNASDLEVSDDFKNLIFETAWDPSIEIMLQISKQNPDIKFGYLYSDEAIGSHVGYMLVHGGVVDYKGTFEDYSYDAYKLAFDIWGCEDDYRYDEKTNTFVLKDDDSIEIN